MRRRSPAVEGARWAVLGALLVGSTASPVFAQSMSAPEDSSSFRATESSMKATPIVALVRSRGDQGIAMRLAAELDALGYRVVEITGRSAVRPLAELSEEHDVHALLRATPSRTGIELLVLVPETEPMSIEATFIEDVISVGQRRHDDLLALRTVEALRARLLEVGLIAPPEVFEAPSIAPVAVLAPEQPTPSKPRSSLFWLELAPGFGGSVPAGMAPRAQFAVRVEPTRTWSVSLLGNLPLRTHRLEQGAGTADVDVHWVGVGGDARLIDASWVWDVGLGAALARFKVEGQAEPPFEGRATSMSAALPFVRTAVHPELSSVVRMRLEMLAGWTAPRSVIGFPEGDYVWGRPYLQGSLVLAVAVPGSVLR